MDDLAKFIIGITAAVFVIMALIFVILYVVLPIALCYYLGKQFYTQVKRCELGRNAKITLGIIGGASILLAAAIVNDSGIHGFFIAPLSGLIFLVIAVLTLAIWIYTKKKRFLDVRYDLKSEKFDIETQMRIHRKGIERLQKKNETLKSKFDETIQEQDRLERYTSELCETDTRTYTILKREWTDHHSKMADKDIDAQEKELASILKKRNKRDTSSETEDAIKLCLFKIEGIKRMTGQPLQKIAANTEKLRIMERERTDLEQKIAKVTEQINRNESAYEAFLNSRIVLD
ncbi:MAG: hypothetical protein IBX72_11455 [Nitrospirae bacterium]|nr:hypothetical protein [Nitrospirota bacterium]